MESKLGFTVSMLLDSNQRDGICTGRILSTYLKSVAQCLLGNPILNLAQYFLLLQRKRHVNLFLDVIGLGVCFEKGEKLLNAFAVIGFGVCFENG